jgi:nicotinamidase/pyrazinamidase
VAAAREAGPYDALVADSRYGPGTALVVVDVQNDFADPDGSLYVRGGEDICATINAEIRAAVAAGSPVIYTQDWHPSVTPHFEKDGGIWPVHCVHGTWGAQFHRGLVVLPDAPIVHKGSGGEDGYSAFSVRDPVSGDVSRTILGELLDERNVDAIVIAGLATDYCVKETALDAIELGYRPSVLVDAVRAVDREPGDATRALETLADAGVELVED